MPTHPTVLKVIIEKGTSPQKEYFFSNSFQIGRDETCEIQIKDGIVSRIHTKVSLEDGEWWITDELSSNGTFVNGEQIELIKLESDSSLQLGTDGPILHLSFEEATKSKLYAVAEDASVTKYIKHYFDKNAKSSGEHTKMIRQAFEVVQKKQSSKYVKIIAAVVFVALVITGYAVYQHFKSIEQKQLAQDMFYEMKTMEIELSKLYTLVSQTADEKTMQTLNSLRARYESMNKKYDNYLNELDIYDMDEKTKLIYKIARMFGECELNMPEGFIDEVKSYIKKWQSTDRYYKAITKAKQNGYPEVVSQKMLAQHLPPQFFYLALQESNFNPTVVGPATRYGYAKGMWQFIPATAIRYGLSTGPLVELPQYDARDERYDFRKATSAAARYLGDIYNTEAQASGLLVMASYNWGEGNVRKWILKLPGNPKERNFWKLLDRYRDKTPDETYKYVYYIFSAAVIGENPRLFGIDMDNPLKNVN
ncbi:MAG: transglycosylase SLT domain-containing protein [bacterium]